jgi:short-subunit dehydrogenase
MARVLIVGATSAIAGAVAKACAKRGDRLFLIARNGDALARLLRDLREITGADECVVGVSSGDFNECELNAARVAEAVAALGGLDLALIAHGFLGDQLESERDYPEARRILATNFDSVVAFLIPIANVLETQGRGSVAVMSSVAADRGRPRNYTYAAAKAGVNTYLEGLRTRLWNTGARVHILKLGPVHSPMTVGHPKNRLFATPERVAGDILRAIERGVFAAYLPWYWRPIMLVVRNLPEVILQRLRFLSGR